MQILFVDDDIDDFEILCDALKEANPEAVCVHKEDGAAALKYLKEECTRFPDYIFLDINMPIMGGIECLKLLKLDSTLHRIPVIMFSTCISLQDVTSYKDLGAKDFLIKPSRFEDIVRMLQSL